ncbi:MAG TPA: bifunctional rhamnulose-1-phosphate aldolase/short-chain dehydrogenase [Caulobacteraceae bacterium]|nr:bifunctional rhamnulose-1-phosphate aldolase/short-chain dehydrogenase [Caulobacteraceae bacterium]
MIESDRFAATVGGTHPGVVAHMDGQTDVVGSALLPNQWDDDHARTLTDEARLLYRSHLLGSDKRITNFGGGNTSSKIAMPDPLTGKPVDVLWVKGSGGDLASMDLDGFATLSLARLKSLEALYCGPEHEDDMVGLYPHCIFGLNGRAPSIDTPLHALIDRRCADHVHPDAVVAIAAAADGEAIAREIYGGDIGWLPWIRPGFELGVRLAAFARAHPHARGAILEAHGLFTWGDSDREVYETTLDVINRAIAWFAGRDRGAAPFGRVLVSAPPAAERRAIAARLMPRLRGLVSGELRKVAHFDDGPAVLEFVGSEKLEALAAIGTSCPDHFLRTKIWPLVLPFDPAREAAQVLLDRAGPAVEAYRARYAAYYDRRRRPQSPDMRDANPVICLVPGVGMIAFAADKAAARVAAEFYTNAINVMREASRVSTYQGLPEQEAFDIEYWALEEAKLRRLPAAKPLAGRIAVITGGAGGIGAATARRLLADGACVMICDIDRDALATAAEMLREAFGPDVVRAQWVDVTAEDAVAELYDEIALAFGGLDICVSNAGIASAAPIEDTSLEVWRRNIDILATGYFLVSRDAVRLLKAQDLGGSLVFVGSKNALAASPGAAAYGAAKASELHLARLLAVECAPLGVRVNVVNPDAVLQGSRIWQGPWRAERAQQHKADPDELEAVYRERSLLKRSVYPEDVAEAVAWFASDRSSKSTGNIINVDAGNAQAFTR